MAHQGGDSSETVTNENIQTHIKKYKVLENSGILKHWMENVF